MENALIIIFTALCSGLIATFVTIWWQVNNQKKTEKNRIFTILMSKRYEISAEESVEALNMIDVVFYKSKDVRNAWKEFNDATNAPNSEVKSQNIGDKHLRLLEVMANDIGYKNIRWDDIKQYYYPIALSERKQDEAVLRRVQIDAGIAQIKQEKESSDSSQISKTDEIAGQVIIEAMKNPDGLSKLMEFAEQAQKFQTK